MIKLKQLLALMILVQATSLYAGNEPIKEEFEIKLPLTHSGFLKFKNLFVDDFEAEELSRDDYYFEIFEEKHFILKNLIDPIKLRFQGNKWQIQKSHTLYSNKEMTAKLAQSISIDIDYNDSIKIKNDIVDFHHQLQELNPMALETASSIKNQLVELKLLKKARSLCEECSEYKVYYSSQINHKTRYKMKLKEQGFEFSIFVGVTKTAKYEAYEIEAELKNSTDVLAAMTTLRRWLLKQGLNLTDILQSSSPDLTLEIEKNLNLILSPYLY
jgi:hypothetical protein